MKSLFRGLIVVCCLAGAVFAQDKARIELLFDEPQKKVEVLIDGSLFTAYIFPDNLQKPVLWPLISLGGNMLTRSYPMISKAGDRVDHPHHIGVWLNYGDVNGLDFWNNSSAIPIDKRDHYGTIHHSSVDEIKSGDNASLTTTATWNSPVGESLLNEQTQHHFSVEGSLRIIDRTTTLTALIPEVVFRDNKEGMFAVRVARELELPINKPTKLIGADHQIIKVDSPDNRQVKGNYYSATGIEGKSVWGTRSNWMQLTSEIHGEQVHLVIIDHPDNVGYPTYWHARDYGLFSANPLGQKVFSNGNQQLNLSLKKGESVTFKYRLIVASGNLPNSIITRMTLEFSR